MRIKSVLKKEIALIQSMRRHSYHFVDKKLSCFTPLVLRGRVVNGTFAVTSDGACRCVLQMGKPSPTYVGSKP